MPQCAFRKFKVGHYICINKVQHSKNHFQYSIVNYNSKNKLLTMTLAQAKEIA